MNTKKMIGTAAALLTLSLSAAGCGTPAPSVAGCRAAMTSEYLAAMSTGKTQETEPAACSGLSHSEIGRLAEQIISSHLPGAGASTGAAPSEAACKADLRSTAVAAGVVRGGTPPAACSGLPPDQVQTWAVDSVSNG